MNGSKGIKIAAIIAFVVGLVVFFIIANHAQKKYNGGWFG